MPTPAYDVPAVYPPSGEPKPWRIPPGDTDDDSDDGWMPPVRREETFNTPMVC